MCPELPLTASSPPSRPLLLFGLLLAAAGGARAQGFVNRSLLAAPREPAVATWSSATFDQVQASVVYVCVEVDGPRGKFVIERASSGVIVDATGLVVTFRHLVAEAIGAADKRLLIQLNDAGNLRLPATVVATDDASGLVLLQTERVDGLSAARLGPNHPRPGEPVLVVARPEGEDMLAFAGVASSALGGVMLDGRSLAADQVFLTDSRNDERCDGAPVFAAGGELLGLYAGEHVQRDKSEPTLAELKQPSFGVVVPTARLRHAFQARFATAANRSLLEAPAAAPGWAAAVEKVAPAVVSVWAGDGDWPEPGPEDPGYVQRRQGLGSGVIVGKRGLVVTNAHVGAAGGSVRVKTLAGDVYPAEVRKTHGGSNLCLLQLDLPAAATLPTAVCAPDDELELGETVLAVGNPLGTAVVVSAGVVSAIRDREGGRVQADANLGNQNGGGAIIDVAGRVVGIGDAGRIDPLDMAYAMRGDRVTQESNLSTFVGIRLLRRVFGDVLADGAAADESIVAPVVGDVAAQQARASALTAMVAKAGPSMLNIYVARNVAKIDEDDPFAAMAEPELMPLSLGSGVIIDRSGLAISNWHVVDDATDPDGSMRDDHVVTARVFGGKEYRVAVLSISREDDLSLLQLQLEPGEEVQAVELGNSEALRIAEAVAAIGNPHGRANTITRGIVSAKAQGIRVRGRWAKLEHLIETDAAINGGNSGGALLDMNGRLVGINSAGGGTFNNKGYAIAVDHVRQQVLGLLLQPYKLRSADLGMRVIDDEGKVLVLDVDERGPAAQAGVRSGDRITSLAGIDITWSPGFALSLLAQPAGIAIELQVDRQGEPLSFSVVPLPSEVWSVIRQSGLQCRDFGYAEDPERVRLASIALHRVFTGDADGEPRSIPQQVVMLDRVFVQSQPDADLQTGDLLLALELRTLAGRDPAMARIGSVSELRDWFNNREIGSYDGTEWRCWIARGNEVKPVKVVAKRLFW